MKTEMDEAVRRALEAVGALPKEASKAPKRGITAADVLRVFPGGRVLTEEEAKALKEGTPAERPQQQQLRLIPGGKK
jgi:hypothetical protein